MTAALAVHLHVLAHSCILNPCSPGVYINPPPINSSAGLGLAGIVAVVGFLVGSGGGGSKKGKK